MPKTSVKSFILFMSLLFFIVGCAPTADIEQNEYSETEAEKVEVISEEVVEVVQKTELEISDRIHVNQIGYRPSDRKVAIVSGQSGLFHLVRSSDSEIVFEAMTTGTGLNDQSTGDTVFFADFSSFNEQGEFFISFPGLGRSFEFEIADDVYVAFGDALLKFMYFQRCGVELYSEHAGEWARLECHLDDARVWGDENLFLEATGGWHDAGDFGKYTVPTAVTLAGMLLAYDLFPSSFHDSLNIPESGNGIPDVLDEARFAFDWLLQMQDARTGGVHHKLSTRQFPAFIMPHLDLAQRYIMPVSPTATGTFAAIMAMSSRIFETIDADFSERALKAAKLAWEWLEANPNAPNYTNPEGVHTGEYGDWNAADERFWAAVELFRTTQDPYFHDFIVSLNDSGNFDNFGFGWQAVAGFGSVSYLFMDSELHDVNLYSLLREELLTSATHFTRMSGFNGYQISLSTDDYFWGSNMFVMNRATHLILAYLLEKNEDFRQTAQDHLHYLLGRNALSQSFVTGFGGNPIMNPHHRPSGADFVRDPIPGMVSGGPNSRIDDPTAERLLTGNRYPARAFVDEEGSWSTNEVTTYWNSPALFVTAFFNR